MSKHRLDFESLCKGPNPEMQKYHKDLADYHGMMHKFYGLEEHHQRAFMAMFEQLARPRLSASPTIAKAVQS